MTEVICIMIMREPNGVVGTITLFNVTVGWVVALSEFK